jgi:hypothetical protein
MSPFLPVLQESLVLQPVFQCRLYLISVIEMRCANAVEPDLLVVLLRAFPADSSFVTA